MDTIAMLTRPSNPRLERLYLELAPLKQILASHVYFLARVVAQVQDLGVDRLKVKFAYTWQKKLGVYVGTPEGAGLPDAAELIVGIVGGGLMGGTVARALLDGGLQPQQLLIATRSPGRQKELATLGVQVSFDVPAVAARAHMIILAVLPAQLPEAARQLRAHLSRHALVVSLVGCVARQKLTQLLGTQHVFALHADKARNDLRADHIHLQPAVERDGASFKSPKALRPRSADLRDGGKSSAAAGATVVRAVATGLTAALVDTASHSLTPTLSDLAQLTQMLPVVLAGLELPETDCQAAALEGLFGKMPAHKAAALSTALATAGSVSAALSAADSEAEPPPSGTLRPLELIRARYIVAMEPLLAAAQQEQPPSPLARTPSPVALQAS